MSKNNNKLLFINIFLNFNLPIFYTFFNFTIFIFFFIFTTYHYLQFFRGKTEKIKKSEVNNFTTLCEVFKNRVVEKNNSQYFIHSIDLEKNVIKVMKLYDDNGIKINLDYYIKKNLLISFNFADLDKNFKILSMEQSKNILQAHQADNKNILKILIKLDSSDNNVQMEGLVYFRAYGKKLTVEKILPEEIDTSKYDIDISGNMVHDVKNKTDNLKVIFTTEEVKEEIDFTPSSLKIYYSILNKSVNILHVHKLDENLKINSVEGILLDRSEDVSKYKYFSNGSSLKILFKNYKINKIFLSSEDNTNVSEIKAEEVCVKLERIMQINSEGAYKDFYAKIKNIPKYLISSGQIPEKIINPFPMQENKFPVSKCTFEFSEPKEELPVSKCTFEFSEPKEELPVSKCTFEFSEPKEELPVSKCTFEFSEPKEELPVSKCTFEFSEPKEELPVSKCTFEFSEPKEENSPIFEKFDVCTSPIVNDTLNGFVDLSLIFDNEEKFVDFPIEISLPVCFLSSIPVTKDMELEKIYSNESLKRKSEEIDRLYSIYRDISSNFEKYLDSPDLMNSLTKEEIKTILQKLGEYKNSLPSIGSYIEQKELWTYLEKLCVIESSIISLTDFLNARLTSI
jgi:hypothetical protein